MIAKLEDNSVTLMTRATPTVLAMLPALEGRRSWLKGGGLRIENTKHNIDHVRVHFPALEIQGAPPSNDVELFEPVASAIVNYQFKRKPDPHQLIAWERSKDKRYFGLFMEQGCVDGDTEYLSPSGWAKIKDYEGGQVTQYNLDGSAEFVDPIEYHIKPCETMAHFKSKYGCDMMLSLDHRMLLKGHIHFWRPHGGDWKTPVGAGLFETTPQDIIDRFKDTNDNTVRRNAYVPCHFEMDGNEIDLTDDEIRLQVAFHADGSFGKRIDRSPSGHAKGGIRVKKERKKGRLRQLLMDARVEFREKLSGDGFSIFTFRPPINSKHFVDDFWWTASLRQKQLMAEEFKHWDGLCSTDQRDIDFKQFCISSCGKRARITGTYCKAVSVSDEPIGMAKPALVPAPEGKMYCFTVPSTYLVFRRNGCVFVSGNTGKTKVEIDKACYLFLLGRVTGVLVVTKKGVHRQWVDAELPKDHGPPYMADYWRHKPLKPELKVQGDSLKWFSINYDALRGKKAREVVREFCQAHNGKLLICGDESQHIMNQSGRHNNMLELKPYSSHRDILTGTPIAKDLTDEWSQLFWLDEDILGIKYLTTFKAKYCLQTVKGTRVSVTGVQNLDEFKRKVDPHTYRVTKEEIGYIPKRYSDWIFDLTAEQHRLIQQVKQELIAELKCGKVVPVTSVTAAFTKVQQIANGFIIDERGVPVRIMPVDKNPRAIAALEYLAAKEGKQVLWTRFIEDRRIMAEAMRLAGFKFVEYTGTDEARYNAKLDFIEDDSVQCFLANPASAGTGTDGLQTVCTQALYYSNSFNALDRWQSEDRIDRRGMIGGSVHTDLIARNSIDRYILRNLKQKKGLSAMVLSDIIKAFDNEL